MIAGIGIDSVEIERFANWANLPEEKLYKLFTKEEIEYCLKNTKKSAERFAARFATKEAFYKTLSQIIPNHTIPLLTVCKHASISQENNGNPILLVNWKALVATGTSFRSLVSITHTQQVATAIVLIEPIS